MILWAIVLTRTVGSVITPRRAPAVRGETYRMRVGSLVLGGIPAASPSTETRRTGGGRHRCRPLRSRGYVDFRLASRVILHSVWQVARIAGVIVADSDAVWLVDELRMVGRADDVTAAWAIEEGVGNGEAVEDLTPAQELAVLLVLAYAPSDSLKILRRKLTADCLDRQE